MPIQDDGEEEDLGIIPNRIKLLRKERDMTLEQLAERAGYTPGHINNIENHKKGFTARSLKKIAAALGVKPGEVLDVSNAWQEVPIFGIVGAKGIIRPAGENGERRAARVRVPLAMGDVMAIAVEGQSLYPRYDDGTVILCPKAPGDPTKSMGRECFVVLANGVSMIRRVERGSSDDAYTLTSHNQPPMLDEEIMTCRPVILALPSA